MKLPKMQWICDSCGATLLTEPSGEPQGWCVSGPNIFCPQCSQFLDEILRKTHRMARQLLRKRFEDKQVQAKEKQT